MDPKNAGIAFDGLARIGILLLLFVAGQEINLKTIRAKANAAAAISLSGIAIPFIVGFAATWFLHPCYFLMAWWIKRPLLFLWERHCRLQLYRFWQKY